MNIYQNLCSYEKLSEIHFQSQEECGNSVQHRLYFIYIFKHLEVREGYYHEWDRNFLTTFLFTADQVAIANDAKGKTIIEEVSVNSGYRINKAEND